MKRALIVIGVVVILIGLVIFLNIQQILLPPGESRWLAGVLFKVDVNGQEKLYMVVTGGCSQPRAVLSQAEIEEMLGEGITPIETMSALKEEEINTMKSKAEGEVIDYIKIPGSEDEILETRDPVLVLRNLNRSGTKPWRYEVLVIGKNSYYFVYFDPHTKEFSEVSRGLKTNPRWGIFVDLTFENGAEEVMKDYLRKNNIDGVIKEKYHVEYVIIGNPEDWLITESRTS